MAKKKKKKGKIKEYPYYPSKFGNSAERPSGTGRVCTLDTEARGLVPVLRPEEVRDQHVIVLKDKETGQTFVFFDPYEKRDPKDRVWLDEWEGEQDGFLLDGVKFINELDVLIAQNWVGYDGHALRKTWPGKVTITHKQKPKGGKKRKKQYPMRVMDTLVMSQLLNPERKPPREAYAMGKGNIGAHSIEAHGIRIGRYKPENEDWTHLTDHMIHRCWEDVAIGEDFFDYLWLEWQEQDAPHPVTGLTIADAYRMELTLYWEMAAQEYRGFRIDVPYAWKLVKTLDEHTQRILDACLPHIPQRIKMKPLKEAEVEKARARYGIDPKYSITGEQKLSYVVRMSAAEAEKVNKKLKKKWKKEGHDPKLFHPRTNKVKYTKDVLTHCGSRATNWGWVTKSGNYSATTTKDYPEAVGSPDDHKNPVVRGPYTPIVWEQVSLGNRDVVRQTLYQYGWRGVNLTENEEKYVDEHGDIEYPWAGKLDQDSMDAWAKSKHKPPEWATMLLEYYVVTHRRGQILNKKDMDYYREHGQWPKQQNGKRQCRGLIPRARDTASGLEFQELLEQYGLDFWDEQQWDDDGDYRVPAAAFAIGTNTFRMRHKYVVNIPSRGLYGKEMRRLFIASDGWAVLGCDGAGLELRMLSHFMNDPDYEAIILHGDIHTHNQEKAGLPVRDMAKTFIYAFLYGSGIANLAFVCGISKRKMEEVVQRFLNELPLLKDLIAGVQETARERGYMKAVDGRWGRVRKSGGKVKEHTALNVLLQMTGSLCMKWGLYLALDMFEEAGIPARLVANVHDEVQMEVKLPEVESIQYKIPATKEAWKEEEKRVMHHESGGYWSAPEIVKEGKKKFTIERKYHKAGDLLCKAFEEAGKYLGIRTPLAGEYKVGESWKDTH